ncbi:ribbon-helix-helix domain-containing protein [Telmatospirillum sp.]|uniref:ribbon-helix-helix domain-containing protein n=1 Tax=Telmatospirillum sp. TaxID=2079197 RepID=UPI00284813E7|nr:ribbon-helix-helix domain-containing protein [Telmatospirillum sp.]MDR3440604.1 hypothetical protein [Telmatospirillum sp.]
MPKPNPLMQGLKQSHRPEPPASAPAVAAPRQSRAKAVPPSRVGRVLIGGHFAPEVQTALKIVAAEERTSVQALLAEGIDAIFARRHKAQIASLSSSFDDED